MKKLNNIRTQDVVRINVNSLGEIVSYAAFYVGAFDKYETTEIDIQVISEKSIDIIKEKYIKNLENYEIDEQFLRLVEDKLLLQTNIIVTTEENGKKINSLESVVYEIQ